MKKFLAGGLLNVLVWSGAGASGTTLIADDAVVDTPLAVSIERAFENLDFERPIVVTHAGDGSNRLFVAEQEGIIKVLKNDQNADEATVFLDFDERCTYADNQNEEGFLGLAFHPKFKQNGEFFVYYTSAEEDHLSKISRFPRFQGQSGCRGSGIGRSHSENSSAILESQWWYAGLRA